MLPIPKMKNTTTRKKFCFIRPPQLKFLTAHGRIVAQIITEVNPSHGDVDINMDMPIWRGMPRENVASYLDTLAKK
jgi:hypothetical protein